MHAYEMCSEQPKARVFQIEDARVKRNRAETAAILKRPGEGLRKLATLLEAGKLIHVGAVYLTADMKLVGAVDCEQHIDKSKRTGDGLRELADLLDEGKLNKVGTVSLTSAATILRDEFFCDVAQRS